MNGLSRFQGLVDQIRGLSRYSSIRVVRSMTSRNFQVQAAKRAVPRLGVGMLLISSLSGSDEALDKAQAATDKTAADKAAADKIVADKGCLRQDGRRQDGRLKGPSCSGTGVSCRPFMQRHGGQP